MSEISRTETKCLVCGCFSSPQICWNCANNPVLMELSRNARRYRDLRDGQNWPAVFFSSDAAEPLRGDELDAAMDGK